MNVTIVQRVLPEYRLALFDEMQHLLAADNIKLSLFYGQEANGSTPVTVNIKRPWAIRYNNNYFNIGSITLVVQLVSFIKIIRTDLIIVEQANSLLLNYFLILFKPIFKYKLAYWGHGYNHQAINKLSFSEKIKVQLLKTGDWWFSYTAGTTRYLESRGVTPDKITTLHNTIDARQFSKDLANLADIDIISFVKKHHLITGKTALYCGGLTQAKEIDFLLQSALIIKRDLANFSLLIIGCGPEQSLVQSYTDNYPWIKYLGGLYGNEKAIAFRSADCILVPGQVGLIAIDSIIAEKPIVVRNLDTHGPEIEYIKMYKTGLCTAISMAEYSDAVISLLSDPKEMTLIKSNCIQHKGTFYIEQMTDSFCSGIKMCLNKNIKVR